MSTLKIGTKKSTAHERIAQFMVAGKKLVKNDDYSKVTAAGIARLCKCSAPLVFAHFHNRDALRASLRKYIASGAVPNSTPKQVKPKVAKPAAKKAAAPKPKVAKPAAKKAAAPKPKVAKPAPKPQVSAKLAPPPAPAGAQ